MAAHMNTQSDTQLHGRALILLRGLWIGVALFYSLMFVIGLPSLIRQYNALTGIALQMGFQGWATENLRAALQTAGLSVGAWTAMRLAAELLMTLGFVGLGLALFLRRSNDRVALFTSLFLVTFGIVSFNSISALTVEYANLAGWLRWLVGLPWLGFYVFFYTFPNGRFVPRWTAVWAPIILLVFVVASASPAESMPTWSLFGLLAMTFLSALFAQVYRYSRVSDATQRAQARWVVFAIAVIALGELIGQGLLPVIFPSLIVDSPTRLTYSMILVLGIPVFLLLPLSIVIAILRYRLWDIDIIIRRTLQYSVLSGLLALTYFGLVVVLQSIFAALTGQTQSPFVTVLSTLAIAALFNPVRRPVQDAIDRRFYRKKYDAAKVIAEFAATCRDETDLDKLTARLIEVVNETMQPESVSLWLKPMADRRRQTAAVGGPPTAVNSKESNRDR